MTLCSVLNTTLDHRFRYKIGGTEQQISVPLYKNISLQSSWASHIAPGDWLSRIVTNCSPVGLATYTGSNALSHKITMISISVINHQLNNELCWNEMDSRSITALCGWGLGLRSTNQ